MDVRKATGVGVAESATETIFGRDPGNPAICVVDGFGVRVSTNSGRLVVSDGIGRYRRVRRFDKGTHGISRLVVLGSTGMVTIDALNWCRRLSIGVVMLTPDGSPVLASTPRMTDDARLRRVQAKAPDEPIGLDLARWLLFEKLTAQAKLLASQFDDHDTACSIGDLAEAMATAETIDALRGIEAAAASRYWQSWTGRPECVPRFAAKDRTRTPVHWGLYQGRRSVLASANGNRKAERPVNGILNYAYSLLEAEAVLACHVVGLDPGLGIVHNDARGRPSLALDLMEPVRPEVDGFVLHLLERRTFRKVDFVETDDGHCRLLAPVTHELAEMMPTWARALAPIAEHVAHSLGQAMAGKYVAHTPLTTRRQRSAQAAVKARKAAAKSAATSTAVRQRPSRSTSLPRWSCPDCGAPVTNHRHVRCDPCIAKDPGQTPELRSRRGQAIAARKKALRAWEEANPGVSYDPDFFRREVLPRLAACKLTEIMATAGCSKGSASDIRRGKWEPHVSTWQALANLVGCNSKRGGRDGPTW